MKLLYAPWRQKYAGSADETKSSTTSTDECIFCKHIQSSDDEQHGILKRFKHCVVMLNKFPYNAGHVLILPTEHKATLDKLSQEVRAELMEATSLSDKIITKALGAEGMNIGMNIGKAAGAGIPSHLHIHLLPRWQGDTNFMPTVGQTKVISFDMNDIYKKLKNAFENE